MQLIRMELQNFRQFKSEVIEFAKGDPKRNVTIVIGENGTGKTTIAQAFTWCFYGKTGFTDKVLINRDVAENMVPDKTEEVKVSISLEYNNTIYTLIRAASYIKNHSNKIAVKTSSFDIKVNYPNGKTDWVKKTLNDSTVANIMPEAMSSYFFFDGERISQMGKEISADKKVNDFANAVRGLLGLDAIMAALDHMKPANRYGVIKSYEGSFIKGQNSLIQKLVTEIAEKKEELEKKKDRILKLDEEKEKANDMIQKKKEEMKQLEEGKKLLEEIEKLEESLSAAEDFRNTAYKDLCDAFSRNLSAFLSLSLINKSADFIRSQNLGQYDLPYVRQETLKYLLKNKECLCGRPLEEHTPEYEHIMGLFDILPPKHLGTVAKEFKDSATIRISTSEDMIDATNEKFRIISLQDDAIEKNRIDLNSKKMPSEGQDLKSKLNNLQIQINACNKHINEYNDEQNILLIEQGKIEGEIEQKEKERTRLNLQNEDNRKTEIHLAYAKRIYEDLKVIYEEEENRVRSRLEETINDLFLELYNGRLELKIDDKYHIDVIDKDYESGVETSDGQNISVIFAFISAIIKMARENAVNNEQMLSSETYPLVMDAPLSTFDKTRIDNVCRMLPTIAEQVIIFIKDTDGDIAREKMGSKIGRSYCFNQLSQFTTTIVPNM